MLTHNTTSVPQQIFAWAFRQETWLHRQLQRAALHMALGQAFACFAAEHPLWAESLFDEYFLRHDAAPLIARIIEPSDRPTAFEFAETWFSQCAAPNSTAENTNLAEVAMAASAFLRHLDTALQPYRSILR